METPIFRPTYLEKATSLTLALEPECTALSCCKETPAAYADVCKADQTTSSYCVFDCGGGTIDITALKYISATKSYKVIIPPMGSAECGGMKVNEEFSQFLQNVVQDENFLRFLSKNRSYHQAILSKIIYYAFENLKVEFGQDANYPGCVGQTSTTLYLALERTFVDFYGKRKIRRRVSELKNPAVSFDFESYTLVMTYPKMAEFFEPILQNISECVVDATKMVDMETINAIYISGGFGGCRYVFKHISTVLFSNCDRKAMKSVSVTVPKNHTLAVSLGAIHYCMNPSIISARIMDASYGIGIAYRFEEGKHSEKHATFDEKGVKFCQNVFRPFVHMNEQVTVNESFTTELLPLQVQQTEAKFGFFRHWTTNPDDHHKVVYITDEDVKKIGELVLNLNSENHDSARIPYSERNIQVSMTFGSTEITAQAQALYLPKQPPVKTADLDFLSK